jgi:hypothetical protein
MNQNKHSDEYALLSSQKDLFRKTINKKISAISCYLDSLNFYIDNPKRVFLDAIIMTVTVENDYTLRFGTNSEICSLLVFPFEDITKERFAEDYPIIIQSNHPEYSTPRIAALVGQTIKKINLYKEEFRDIRTKAFPWETGVEFVLENGVSFFIAYGYQDETDRLCLVFPDEVHLNISDWWSIFETIE